MEKFMRIKSFLRLLLIALVWIFFSVIFVFSNLIGLKSVIAESGI
jgi:hypothetical protein